MYASRLLRITAAMILLFSVGHTCGYPWYGTLTSEQQANLAGAVKSTTAVTQGFTRTYSDYHVGFGLYIALFLLVQAILVWRLGALVKPQPATVKFIAALFAAQYLGTVVLDFYYFFWGPIVFSALIAACFIAVFAISKPNRDAPPETVGVASLPES